MENVIRKEEALIIRFSATGLGYNTAFAIFSGTAPMVSTWLIHRTGDLASPAIYLVVLGIISLPAYILVRPAPGGALEDEGAGVMAG